MDQPSKRALLWMSWLLALVLLPSCIPKGQEGAGAGSGGDVAVAPVVRKPAAEVIPHDVSYALVIKRGQWAARALDDMLRPFGVNKELSKHAVKDLGFDPLDSSALAEAGFAPDREVAVYGHGVLPTFVLPVANEARMTETLRRVVGNEKVGVREFAGHSVTAWRDSFVRIAWVQVDGWLYVHFALSSQKDEDSWLRAVLDPKGGVGQALAAAAAHSPSGDALGFVKLPELGQGLRQLGDNLHVGTCPAVDGTVSLFASLEDGGVKAGLFVPLRARFRTELGRHVGKPPDGAFLALRDRATAFASLGLDLSWLSGQQETARKECTLLFWMLEAIALWDQKDPTAQMALGGRYVNSYHLVVDSVDVQTGDVKGAGWFGLSGSRGLQLVLGLATGGMRKQRRNVNGRSVTRLNLGKMAPMLDKVDYILAQDAVRVGVGSHMIEALLSEPSSKDAARARLPGRDLFAIGLRPSRVAQNQGLLATGANLLHMPSGLLKTFLSTLDRLSFTIRLEQAGLRVTSGFHLR